MLLIHEFHQILSRISGSWAAGDVKETNRLSQEVLRQGTDDMKAECLLLLGMAEASWQREYAARERWLEGLSYVNESSFVKCRLEVSLATSFRQSGDFVEAKFWYYKAIETCSGGGRFACPDALIGYSELSDSKEIQASRAFKESLRITMSVLEIEDDSQNLLGELETLKVFWREDTKT